MEWPIDMEWIGWESIGCYTRFVIFNVPLTHDLHLGFSRSNFEKVVYLRNGMADLHGIKGMESIECSIHVVTFNVPLTHDLDLGFSRSNLKKPYPRNGRANWHGTKWMWVDRMLHPLCDFQCPPHPWPWPWIFEVKFWKSRISGMGWPIDMELKGCESIECWIHVVTFNAHLTHDLDLGLSRSNFENAVSQEWEGQLIWMWVDRMLHPLCGFQLWPHPWPWPWIFKVKFWKSRISG